MCRADCHFGAALADIERLAVKLEDDNLGDMGVGGCLALVNGSCASVLPYAEESMSARIAQSSATPKGGKTTASVLLSISEAPKAAYIRAMRK